MKDIAIEAGMALLFIIGFLAFVLWFGCTNQAAHFYSQTGIEQLNPQATDFREALQYLRFSR